MSEQIYRRIKCPASKARTGRNDPELHRGHEQCGGTGFYFGPIAPNPYDEIVHLRSLLRDLQAFIGVMFGQGEDSEIPEAVITPLGAPVKLGEIMRETRNALNGEPEQTVG